MVIHLTPEDMKNAANAAQGTASTPWWGNAITGLISSVATALTAWALWVGKSRIKRTRTGQIPSDCPAGPRQPVIPEAALRTHDDQAREVEDAMMKGAMDAKLNALRGEMQTYWRKHDDLAKEVGELGKKIAGLPDRQAAVDSERRILDAVYAQAITIRDCLSEHVRHYHSKDTV